MMESELTIIENEEEFLVVWDNDPADWVARFRKDGGFPAEMWAKRMVELYKEVDQPQGNENDET